MYNALKVREIYNKRANKYDRILGKLRYHKTLKNILNSVELDIPKNGRILDIGCGTGLATDILKKRFPKFEIIGLDYSEGMLLLYNEKFPSIETIMGDFNDGRYFYLFPSRDRYNLKQNYFDSVISTGAVSEYGNVNKVIPLIYKILKKNGIFLNLGIEKNAMSIVTGRLWHYKPTGKKRFFQACQEAGFSHVEIIKLSWKHFPTNITKFVLRARK